MATSGKLAMSAFCQRVAVRYHLQPMDEEMVVTSPPSRCSRLRRAVMDRWKAAVFILAPCALSPLLIWLKGTEYRASYVVALMAVYWLTEALPLAVTALIPVFLFPMLGVASAAELCPTYMKEVMMMTLASLMLGVAMEHHNVHKRIALKMLLVIGTGPRRLLLGFLCTAAFLSMVTTNCATATMMVPVAKAVLEELSDCQDSPPAANKNGKAHGPIYLNGNAKPVLQQTHPVKEKAQLVTAANRPLYLGCLLGVAYGTSIGGTGTLTGAAPNLILKSHMDDNYPDHRHLTFSNWALYSLPSMVVAIMVAWAVLYLVYVRKSKTDGNVDTRVRSFMEKKYEELGRIRIVEVMLGLLFFLLMLLWFFRQPNFMTGWADLFPWSKMIGNATPAVLVALLLFVIPRDPFRLEVTPPILDWKTAQERTPWGVLLLLGGGLALAHGATKSGLMRQVALQLKQLSFLSPVLLVSVLCFITLATTEILSNTSTASLFIPVIDQLAISLEVHPLLFLMPVTICCSYAFMLPMATSPNAITYENSDMKTSEMALPGIVLNVLCCFIQVGAIYSLGSLMFSLETPLHKLDSSNNNSTQLPNVTSF